MQQQFTKIAVFVLAIIAVATIASLATAVVMLSRSGDGAGSSSVSQSTLGAQIAQTPSARGDLKERANVLMVARGERGRIEGQIFLDVFVNDQGKVTVQTRVEVGGLPIGEYGLWLEPPENFQDAGLQPRLLRTGTARDALELGRDATQSHLSLTEVPVSLTTLEDFTLEGFTLSFRQMQDGIGPASVAGPVLLSRTISGVTRYP